MRTVSVAKWLLLHMCFGLSPFPWHIIYTHRYIAIHESICTPYLTDASITDVELTAVTSYKLTIHLDESCIRNENDLPSVIYRMQRLGRLEGHTSQVTKMLPFYIHKLVGLSIGHDNNGIYILVSFNVFRLWYLQCSVTNGYYVLPTEKQISFAIGVWHDNLAILY